MRTMRTVAMFVLICATWSCGRSEAPQEKKGPSQAELDKAIASANGAVTSELPAQVEFAVYKEPKKGRFVAIVPKDWKESDVIPGSFEAPEPLGSMTRFRVGTNCDGTCQPKDWAGTAEKVNFKQLRSGTVSKEEDLDGGGKLIVATKGASTYVSLARWSEKGRFYLTCAATLEKEAAALASAAEIACKAIATDRW